MPTPAHVTEFIKRLCDLELGSGRLAAALSDLEKRFEIARLRSIIPASILGYHDRMLQRGKRTIVPVLDGVCSACQTPVPVGQLARLRSSQDLELCDHCGTFIYFERAGEAGVRSASARVNGKRVKGAVR